MQNLSLQQLSLASADYDLRITNLARFIYKKLPIKSGKLIDIGAGNGLLLKFFKTHRFDVAGIELKKDQVHAMKQDLKLKDVPISQGDIMKLKGNASYEVVISSDVIEHIRNDQEALNKLWSYVVPGGYLVITVPAHQYLYGKRDIKWGHFRRYNKRDVLAKLTFLHHATVISLSYWNVIGYLGYFIYEKIFNKPIREDFRYNKSVLAQIVRILLDLELRIEELMGGVFIGLTLIAIVRKDKII